MDSKLSLSKSPFYPLLLIAPFFFWGTAMVAMKGVMPHTTPVLLTAIALGRPQPHTWKAWGWIGLFALVDGALFQGFLAMGLARTEAGLGSVMIDSQPLAVALLAFWLFGERIGLWGWLGLALGVTGISLLGLPDEWILGVVQHRSLPEGIQLGASLIADLFQNGQWLMLLAAVSMAVGTVLLRYVSRHADPVVATGWHMILGGLPLFALSSQLEIEQFVHLDGSNWLAMTYSTVFGSAIAYALFFYFASSGSLTSLSALTFLTPIFALLFGHLFLGEVLSPVSWGGVCLTLVSIFLINQRDRIAATLSEPALLPVGNEESPAASLPEMAQVAVPVADPE
jgi:drug/metabolite transporter (DMT)-like permease